MSVGTWGYAGMRCKIKRGFAKAGREGDALSFFQSDRSKHKWIVVHWDDEENPNVHKADELVIRWREYGKWEAA